MWLRLPSGGAARERESAAAKAKGKKLGQSLSSEWGAVAARERTAGTLTPVLAQTTTRETTSPIRPTLHN